MGLMAAALIFTNTSFLLSVSGLNAGVAKSFEKEIVYPKIPFLIAALIIKKYEICNSDPAKWWCKGQIEATVVQIFNECCDL